ncbi:MAG: GAF domain-containing protein [Candidatus Omnitrophica bacterium]|nr:GAF domain-containing protein [Candidatus Omnitrophota bacterium]
MDQNSGLHIIGLAKKPLAAPAFLDTKGGRLVWAASPKEFLELIKVHKPVAAMIEQSMWDESDQHFIENVLHSEDVRYAVIFRAEKEVYAFLDDEKKSAFIDVCASPMTDENLIFYIKKCYEILRIAGQLRVKDERESHEITQNIRKLERKVFDFFTLSQLGKSLLSIQDMQQLCHVFISSVYEASGASNCAIFVNDDSKLNFHLKKAAGLPEEEVKDLEFMCEEGLFWQVLNSGEPFYIRDSTGEYRFKHMIEKWNLDKIESLMWFPLMVKDSLVGVLTLGKRKDGSVFTATARFWINKKHTRQKNCVGKWIICRRFMTSARRLILPTTCRGRSSSSSINLKKP